MPTFSESRLRQLLLPYLEAPLSAPPRRSEPAIPDLVARLSIYLELLLRWNSRTNLTAVRDPELIAQRHFGESLFAGRELLVRIDDRATVLDFGSGAGFPGLPIQLLAPGLQVTLAESQSKKVAFLREAVRTLECGAEVWSARVEDLPAERRFDAVVMRAVDNPEVGRSIARGVVRGGGWFMEMKARAAAGEGGIPIPGLHSGALDFQQLS